MGNPGSKSGGIEASADVESQSVEKKTIEELFQEVADNLTDIPLENSEEEKKVLEDLKDNYDSEKLNIIVETQEALAELRSELERIVADRKVEEGEMERIDEILEDQDKGGIHEMVEEEASGQEVAEEVAEEGGEKASGREAVEANIEKKIEKVEDLRRLSISELFTLESKYEGILFYAFTDFVEGSEKVNFDRWDKWYRDPKEGEKFKINFQGNQEAYNKLGAADILPPSVRGITLLPGGSESGKRVSTRRVGLKGRRDNDGSGFFDKRGYIPIFTGDVVIIGGIEADFDKKYRKPAEDGRLGELDYEAYAKDHGTEDREFMASLPRSARRGKGGSFKHADILGLDMTLEGKPLEQILEEAPDMYHYASKYREKYREGQYAIDIPESVIFSLFLRESSFDLDAAYSGPIQSDATGLGQFLSKTWRGFLDANPWAVDKLNADPIWGSMDEREWRKNPEMMIAATYWYVAQNARGLRNDRHKFSYSEFQNSRFVQDKGGDRDLITLQEEDTWIVYLAHHDGLGGARKMLRYKSMQEAGTYEEGAIAFKSYQLEPGGPEGHWNFLVHGSGSADVTGNAVRYRGVLENYTPTAECSNWGWTPEGTVLEDTEARSLVASQTRLIGDSLFVDASKHMEFGGESVPHAREAEYVVESKQIQDMRDDLNEAIANGEFDGVESVAIMAGANNVSWMPPKKFEKILQEMVDSLLKVNPDIRIVLVTLPPVSGYKDYPSGTNKKAQKYNNIIRGMALDSSNITYVDLYEMVEDPNNPGHIHTDYNGDGLHLNGSGYALMNDAVAEAMQTVEVSSMEHAEIPEDWDDSRNRSATAERPYRTFISPDGNVLNGGCIGYGSGKGGTYSSELARSQIESLADMGITRIISLTYSHDEGRADLRKLFAEYDTRGVIQHEKWDHPFRAKHFEAMGEIIRSGQPVFIHCRHGAHRAPVVTMGGFLASGQCSSFDDAFKKTGAGLASFDARNSGNAGGPKLFRRVVQYAIDQDIPVEEEYYEFIERTAGIDMRPS